MGGWNHEESQEGNMYSHLVNLVLREAIQADEGYLWHFL
jgi:hypothetical protein